MEYRKLGKSGLHLSALSLGSWHTFGSPLDLKGAKDIIHLALDHGINFFDNAEVYENGASELLFGEAIKGHRRENLIISTKIFWGGSGPNQSGLNWKHLVEGTKNSLKKLQLEYVDILICHRPDPETPIEESMRAIETLIQQGLVFYWGTSDWPAKEIADAYRLANELHLTPPTLEQPEYNLFTRNRTEEEYQFLYKKYGLGLTVWGALKKGAAQEQMTQLNKLAHQVGCSLNQLMLAWCLKNPNVTSIILEIKSLDDLKEQMYSIELQNSLKQDVLEAIDQIFPINYSSIRV